MTNKKHSKPDLCFQSFSDLPVEHRYVVYADTFCFLAEFCISAGLYILLLQFSS